MVRRGGNYACLGEAVRKNSSQVSYEEDRFRGCLKNSLLEGFVATCIYTDILLLSLNECIQGVSLSAFYGNFFVRSTDLLALANVNPDSAIAVQVNVFRLTPVFFQLIQPS